MGTVNWAVDISIILQMLSTLVANRKTGRLGSAVRSFLFSLILDSMGEKPFDNRAIRVTNRWLFEKVGLNGQESAILAFQNGHSTAVHTKVFERLDTIAVT